MLSRLPAAIAGAHTADSGLSSKAALHGAGFTLSAQPPDGPQLVTSSSVGIAVAFLLMAAVVYHSFRVPKAGFGDKSIGLWGGTMLLINNLAGPTISLMPSLTQEAGWLVLLVLMVVLTLLSALCGHMLIYAMRAMPGNNAFQLRVEYSDLLLHYLGGWWHFCAMGCYLSYVVMTLMSYIIQTSQVLDYASLDTFGCAYGLQFAPTSAFVCGTERHASTPFGNGMVLSVSSLLVAVVCGPLATMNLDDNVGLQVVAIVGLSVLVAIWLVLLEQEPSFPREIPMATSSVRHLIGVMLFNFAFMSSVPSWANETKKEVSISKCLLISLTYVSVAYAAIGVMGALAYPPFYHTDENLFSKINASGSWLGKLTVQVYPIMQNFTSIPVFSIILRYNLLHMGFPSRSWATAVAFLAPWLLSVLFYTGLGFEQVANVGGIFFGSFVNFLLPMALFVIARRQGSDGGQSHPFADLLCRPVTPSRSKSAPAALA